MKERTEAHFSAFFEQYPQLRGLESALHGGAKLLTDAFCGGGKVLVCGNGGSAADAEHAAGELLKSFVLRRPIEGARRGKLIELYGGEEGNRLADGMQQGLACIPLTSFCAYNTAFLNDCNDEMLFAQLVNALGKEGDVLWAFSTSGNSANVLAAAKVARALGMRVLAMTGSSGGKLRAWADVLLNVPSDVVYRIQELHLPVYHILCLAAESECFAL